MSELSFARMSLSSSICCSSFLSLPQANNIGVREPVKLEHDDRFCLSFGEIIGGNQILYGMALIVRTPDCLDHGIQNRHHFDQTFDDVKPLLSRSQFIIASVGDDFF